MAKEDLSVIGKRFDNVIVEERTNNKNAAGSWLYKCRCVLCGRVKYAAIYDIRNGRIKDCGHHKRPRKDLTGMRFGRLTAMYYIDEGNDGKKYRGCTPCSLWHCKCDCGGEIDVRSHSLLCGATNSCGCMRKEACERMRRKNKNRGGCGKRSELEDTGVGFYHEAWMARVYFNKKLYYLGQYKCKDDAIVMREEAKGHAKAGDFLQWYQEAYPQRKEELIYARKALEEAQPND